MPGVTAWVIMHVGHRATLSITVKPCYMCVYLKPWQVLELLCERIFHSEHAALLSMHEHNLGRLQRLHERRYLEVASVR